MRTLILSIAAVAALTNPANAQEPEKETGLDVIELTDQHQTVIDAAGNMLVAMTESKLAAMANLQPEDFISEDMVRAAVRGEGWGDWRSASWAAREQVFGEFQCSIFEHFERPDAECYRLLATEADKPNGSYARYSSLPAELPVLSRQMRQLIYGVGRTYLKSSENLQTVYEQHVNVAVDEFNRLFFADQEKFRSMLQTMITAIEESRDPQTTEVLQAVEQAEYELRNIPDRKDERYQPALETLRDARTARDETISDLLSLEFINRRFIEGGPDLVTAYEEIFTDLLGRVTSN